MKQAFKEVIIDLWNFVFGTNDTYSITHFQASDSTTKQQTGSYKKDTNDQSLTESIIEERIGYIVVDNSVCFAKPAPTFDSMVGRFKYGQKIKTMAIKNGYVHVRSDPLRGWVSTNDVTLDPSGVFPHLVSGQTYDSNNTETLKLRRYIDDEALGGKLELCLQPLEFILYRFKREGVGVNRFSTEPRLAGTWQHTLRGKPGVSMGIEPRTGSVLEYSGNESNPFIAYVKSVQPDRSIVIEGVGRNSEGEYIEEALIQNDWKEWRPVFISFT